jgi:hypothetical protein
MDMMQTMLFGDVGQPPWLPDGQWRDLDKLSGEAFGARLGGMATGRPTARPLSLKERLRVEKRLTKH